MSRRRMTSAVARRYARALLEVAAQRDAEDEVAGELDGLADLFDQDVMLRRTLTDPLVREARRREVLEALLDAAAPSGEVAALLRELREHDRMGRVGEVAAAYRLLLDARRGVVEVEVRTAEPLDAPRRERLREALERMTGKEVRLVEETDESLLGGVVARIGDVVYDASVQGRLRQIRREMAAAEA